MRHLAIVGVTVAFVLSRPAAAQAPLPDLSTFLHEVRVRVQTDAQRQYDYSYIERQRKTTLDADGRASDVSTVTLESHPGFSGEARWQCVIERDGQRVPEDELKKEVEKRRREVEDHRRTITRQTADDRARQERDWDKRRRELADTIDDIFRVFEIRMLRREVVDGHGAIVVSLEPRPGAKPVSEDGRWFASFRGRAWISESEFELMHAEVEALDDLNIGFGLLARLHQGTRAVFDRRKVGEGRWLPIKSTVTMSARVLLLKHVRQELTSEYSSYRRGAGGGSCIISP